MQTTGKAPQQALNLQAINAYFYKNYSAGDLACELDYFIAQINDLAGMVDELPHGTKEYSSMIFVLIELKNLFLKTAIDNGESINFLRVKKSFEF